MNTVIELNQRESEALSDFIRVFQNKMLGLDCGRFETDYELINWWLSEEQQEFIKQEIESINH